MVPRTLFLNVFLLFFLHANPAQCNGPPRFVPIDAYYAVAVSADGSVVAGYSGSPYIWREATGVQPIPLPPGHNLFMTTDISGDGTTIVGGIEVAGSDRHYEMFRWRQDTGYQLLGRLPSERYQWAFATGVSSDGSVVVGTYDTLNRRRAVRWTQATGLVNLGTLGSANPYPLYAFSEAGGVSADGKITVGYVTTTEDEYYKAFRWTEPNGYDVIGLPSADNPLGIPAGGADAISGDGSVIGGISQLNGFDNWTWNEQTGFSLLEFETPQNSGRIHSISFDGSVIVGRQITWNQPVLGQVTNDAVLWQRTASGYKIHRIASLLNAAGVSMPGWHLEEARDVADDGRTIVGIGTDPTGTLRSWYAVLPVIVPEPSSHMLAALALACYVFGVFRSRPTPLNQLE